jgi:Methyltransferase domain
VAKGTRPNGKHWDSIFSKTEDAKLGWHEQDTSKIFELLNQIPDWGHARIFLPGVGTSPLIEKLLTYDAHLVLNDISKEALNKVRRRLGDAGDRIDWLFQDIAQPVQRSISLIDIWVDRAVLHFLIDDADIKGYFGNVRALVKEGGYAIFAEFSMTGAKRCAGLPVHRYSIGELSERLGPSFRLVSYSDYTYINPFGEPRPYIYALFKKTLR